ncbi:uncharacterized protein LOC128167333 [Crassostrea angulata]|uniref:uncharacterized protein LOC128167333 n=1 Tax=Magallana angulata TaxID=2784310 RepID=UPI0022B0EEF2|nr:uncharacterized protein LOC128167333 [Crassostrea angulata]
MEKLVYSVCFLTVCFLISDSSCLDMAAKKFSLFKLRQSSHNFKKRSFSGDDLNVGGKPQVKRQVPPPPPPPPAVDLWALLGTSRENFIEEHEEGLTTDVMTDIKNQMMDNLNDVKNIAELWARAISCQILAHATSQAKRTTGETEPEIEEEIEEFEKEEEKDLEELLASFDIDETNLEELVKGLPLPGIVLQCKESPLIMRTGDDTVDKLQTLAICGRFLMVKTAEAVDQHDVDTVDNFVDGFERYMKGALTFIHMIFLAVEEPDDPSVREFTRLLQENKLHELKRYLQSAIAGIQHRK